MEKRYNAKYNPLQHSSSFVSNNSQNISKDYKFDSHNLRSCKSDVLNTYMQTISPIKCKKNNYCLKVFHRVLNFLTPLLGIFMALLQCISVAFVSLIVSHIEKAGYKNITIYNLNETQDDPGPQYLQVKTGVSPFLISNMRFVYQILIALPLAIYNKNSLIPPKKYVIPVLFRCIAGSIGVIALTFAMSYAPISDASSIVYTSPIYVAILARIFLGEKVSIIDSFLLLITIFGVIFITRPSAIFKYILPNDLTTAISDKKYPKHYLGLGFAAISAFASSVAIVSMRKVRSLPFALILIDFAIVGVVLTTVLCLSFKAYTLPPCTWDRYLLIGCSLLGSLAQFFLYGALQFENAGIISAVSCMGIVFTLIFQIVFKRETIPWTSSFGASLVTVSIFALGLRKWLIKRRDIKKSDKQKKLERINEILDSNLNGKGPVKKFSDITSMPSTRSLDETVLKRRYKLPAKFSFKDKALQLVPEENELSLTAADGTRAFGLDFVSPVSASVPQSGTHTPTAQIIPHPVKTAMSPDFGSAKAILSKKISTSSKKVSRSSQRGIAGLIDNLSRKNSLDHGLLPTLDSNLTTTSAVTSSSKDSISGRRFGNLLRFASLKYPGKTVVLSNGEKVFVNQPKKTSLTSSQQLLPEPDPENLPISDTESEASSIEYGAVTPAPD